MQKLKIWFSQQSNYSKIILFLILLSHLSFALHSVSQISFDYFGLIIGSFLGIFMGTLFFSTISSLVITLLPYLILKIFIKKIHFFDILCTVMAIFLIYSLFTI